MVAFNLGSSISNVAHVALPFVFWVVMFIIVAGIILGVLWALSYRLSFNIPFYYDEFRNDGMIGMLNRPSRIVNNKRTNKNDELQLWNGWFKPLIREKPPSTSDFKTLHSGKRYLYYVFWNGKWLPKRTRIVNENIIDEFDPSEADINWQVSKAKEMDSRFDTKTWWDKYGNQTITIIGYAIVFVMVLVIVQNLGKLYDKIPQVLAACQKSTPVAVAPAG